MKERYVTVVGVNYYCGVLPFAIGQKVRCVKEPDNPYDAEAIEVIMEEMGTVGHIANSIHTVAKGTMSAGRIYDSVPDSFMVEVMFIVGDSIVCKVLEKRKNGRK